MYRYSPNRERIRVAIPSYNRPKSISTHRWLEASGVRYSIFLHNEEQRARYAANPTIDPNTLVVTEAPVGLISARQAVLDDSAAGAWVIFLDDDLAAVEGVPAATRLSEPWYWQPRQDFETETRAVWRERYAEELTALRFLELALLDIRIAATLGIPVVSWAIADNYFFRGTKHSLASIAGGYAFAIKAGSLRYDTQVHQMEDISLTAECILGYGGVFINRYIAFKPLHHQPGGLGLYDARIGQRLEDTAHFMRKYPGLFRYMPRPGQHPHADVALRLHTPRQIQNWRREMGKNDSVNTEDLARELARLAYVAQAEL